MRRRHVGLGERDDTLREAQQRYLPMVEQAFGPVPLRTVPFFDREMVGIARLREVGEALFGTDDPTTVFYRGRPYEVLRENGHYVLKLELPFTTRGEVKVTRTGQELVLVIRGSDGATRRVPLTRRPADPRPRTAPGR